MESILESAAVGKEVPTEEIVQHFKNDSDLLTEQNLFADISSFTYSAFKNTIAH